MTAIRYGNLHVQLLVQHGTRLDRVELETPAPRLRVSGLGQAAPATGAPLVGRGELLDRLAGLAHPGWAVELRAACGFGKSSLLADRRDQDDDQYQAPGPCERAHRTAARRASVEHCGPMDTEFFHRWMDLLLARLKLGEQVLARAGPLNQATCSGSTCPR
jgi:hypothetical protein